MTVNVCIIITFIILYLYYGLQYGDGIGIPFRRTLASFPSVNMQVAVSKGRNFASTESYNSYIKVGSKSKVQFACHAALSPTSRWAFV